MYENVEMKAFEMTPQVKAHATKPHYMSSSPWMHKMEGEAWLLKSVLCPLTSVNIMTPMHADRHQHTNKYK